MIISLQKHTPSLTVISNNKKILVVNEFPILELKSQLSKWLEQVTEKNSKCFIFKNNDKELTGIFRIEPRKEGWQFTSFKEKHRSDEIMSLSQWKQI